LKGREEKKKKECVCWVYECWNWKLYLWPQNGTTWIINNSVEEVMDYEGTSHSTIPIVSLSFFS